MNPNASVGDALPSKPTVLDAPAVPEVPVGVSTQAGLAATLVAYVLAVVAFLNGDRTEETVTALVVGTVALAGVMWGRFIQARELIRNSRSRAAITVQAVTSPREG